MSGEGTRLAPDGFMWVCQACGKKSRTQYGFDDENNSTADRGWDVSCAMNSQLVPVPQ